MELALRNPKVVFLLVLSSRATKMVAQTPPNVRVIQRQIDDIYDIYHLSDLYLFPLRDRGAAVGSPLTMLEAAAAGLPILCSDRPELRETLAGYPHARFLAMDDESSALAQASEYLQSLRHHDVV
jgi:glycosyltransferase involved in cell wall biosynthesis